MDSTDRLDESSSSSRTVKPSPTTTEASCPNSAIDLDLEKHDPAHPLPPRHSLFRAATPPLTHPIPTLPTSLSLTLSHLLTTTTTTTPSPSPLPPPPDRGLEPWTQALLVHLVNFNTWGYANSFGLFQTYYSTSAHPTNPLLPLSPPTSPASISRIGSLHLFLIFFLGTFSGRATDAGYFRPTFILGTILQLSGVFATSFCRGYWPLLLAQGLCTGVGNGLVFVPSVAVVSVYFRENRSMALGLCAAGSATGGLVFPAMAVRLLPTIGFAWTVRAMGAVMLVSMTVCAVFLKPRLPPRKAGPVVEWAAFRERSYALFSLGVFLIFLGLYFGFYFVGSFATDVLAVEQSTAINLLLTMNGVGLPGRLIPGYFADRYVGPFNVLVPLAAIACLLVYCWIAVDSVAGMWVFVVFYGVFAAAFMGLFPAALASLTTDPKRAGVRMGMVFSVVSFGVLLGPPTAGALISLADGRYIYAQIFAASSMAAGWGTLLAARVARAGTKWRVKV